MFQGAYFGGNLALKQPSRKMDKRNKEAVSPRSNPHGQQIHEKMFNLVSNQGNVNQTHNDIGNN